MADRVQNRLMELGSFSANVLSSTRRDVEPIHYDFSALAEGIIPVTSNGGEYQITEDEDGNDRCSCIGFRTRGYCRHITGLSQAMGETRETLIRENAEAIRNWEAENQIVNQERAEENNISHIYEDDNDFYRDNVESFARDWEEARHMRIPYEWENVLNGSNITFGVELEFVDGDSNAIARDLYNLGICGNSSMGGYHSNRTAGKWSLERDASVTNGNRGGEIISPILTDTPETWRQIEIVCEVAKRHGARVDFRTGAHVHVGTGEVLDGKRQRWRRFFKLNSGIEKVYGRLSGGEQGRMRGNHYAQSSLRQNRRGITRRLPEEASTESYLRQISAMGDGKYSMLNLKPASSKTTVEFRGFNGSLLPGIVQANIKFACGIVNTSERSRIKISSTDNISPSESDRKRGRIINEYDNFNVESEEGIMYALDAIFPRKKDKKHIMSVMAKNEWSSNF